MADSAEDIFLEALDVSPGQRDDFVKAACGGNLDLLKAVQALLADSQAADAIFSAQASSGFSSTGSLFLDQAGDQIGLYTLLEVIGEGGFGVVWLAEQKEPLPRRVALKIVKAGMDTAEVLARFEAERQALARMEHPNIARVLDAGATPNGRPYFVMEWVRGIPITRFCDENRLSMRERLSLFLGVCAAVGHAHQKGIIHRDIKPTNVLVGLEDGRPTVKVIDFGIAKAIEGRLTDFTLLTRQEQVLGTPAYMSPEQAGLGSRDIDTRSDIYALGVLLYELIAGVPPFDSKTLLHAGYEEMRRVIREVEPARPSSRLTTIAANEATQIADSRNATPSELRKLIAPELDWIVMKAIEKTPERRYESAGLFSQDITRFLRDEAVLARPPSRWYLLGKFARRHRPVLLGLSAFLVLMIAATIVSSILAIRAIRAERLADSRLAEAVAERNAKDSALKDAEAVSQLMSEIFQKPRPSHDGRTVTVADALDASLKDIDEKLRDQPARLLLLKQSIANTYTGLGLFERALGIREEILEQRRIMKEGSPDELIDALSAFAETAADMGLREQAIKAGTEALELSKRVHGDTSEQAERLQDRLNGYQTLTEGAPNPKDVKDAGSGTQEAVSEVSKKRSQSKVRLQEMDTKLAELRQSHSPDDPAVMEYLEKTALAYYNSGYRADAVRLQHELLEIHLRGSSPEDPRTLEIESMLARFMDRAEMWAAAAKLRMQVLDKGRNVLGEEHSLVLGLQSEMILRYFLTRKFEDARTMGEQAVPRMDKVFGPTSRGTAHARSGLGRAYAALGETAKAIETLSQCGPHMPDDTYANMTLAALQLWSGQEEGYNATRRWMLDYAMKVKDRYTNRADILYRNLIICSILPPENEKQASEMWTVFQRAEIIERTPGSPPQRDTATVLRNLVGGILAYRTGDLEQAESRLRACLVPFQRRDPKLQPTPRQFLANFYLSIVLQQLGKTEEAREVYDDILKAVPEIPSQEHPLLGSNDAAGEPLLVWLAAREAAKILGGE